MKRPVFLRENEGESDIHNSRYKRLYAMYKEYYDIYT